MQLLSSFDETGELRKLSCTLSLVNSHQLSCNSCSRLTRQESRENSHANSRLPTLIKASTLTQLFFPFDRGMTVEKSFMQTLDCQLSCNSCSRLTGTRELRKLSCTVNSRFSTVISSHATLNRLTINFHPSFILASSVKN